MATVTIMSESFTYYLREHHQNNLWVYHLYVPLVFILMVLLYKKLLDPLVKGQLLWALGFLYLVFSISNSIYWQPISTLNTNAIWLSNLIFMGLSLIYFYFLLKSPIEVPLKKLAQFWLNLAILIYYSSTLIIFLFISYIDGLSPELVNTTWWLNTAMFAVLNVLYAISLWINSEKVVLQS